MDPILEIHNTHLSAERNPSEIFQSLDPHLRNLKNQIYIYHSPLIEQLPTEIPGIYTIGGGRQIGKTTILKQWMLYLLNQQYLPHNIFFLTGEVIDDHHQLIRLVSQYLKGKTGLIYLIIDEITYVKDWDKGIKFLADAGLLTQVILILSGSDLILMQEARMRFPGRRGQAATVDFHIYPLSFRSVVQLIHPEEITTVRLNQAFEQYLCHGGYLTAINDLAKHHQIQYATYLTYSDWIRGDCLKKGKSEHYLIDFFEAMFKTYGSQITWNTLAQHMTIEHPKTVYDYASLLASMDAVFIQSALLEHQLTAAPKKAKKLWMTDPFIFHAINTWLDSTYQAFQTDKYLPSLVETVVINHFQRLYPTYYIKAEGEVDVAYIKDRKFWPLEIKWTQQLREKDIKQIKKYNNGLILSKSSQEKNIHGLTVKHLPTFLYEMLV